MLKRLTPRNEGFRQFTKIDTAVGIASFGNIFQQEGDCSLQPFGNGDLLKDRQNLSQMPLADWDSELSVNRRIKQCCNCFSNSVIIQNRKELLVFPPSPRAHPFM